MAEWTWRSYSDRRRGGAHQLDGQIRDWAPENDLHYYREYLDKSVGLEDGDDFLRGRPRDMLTGAVNEVIEEAGSDSTAVRRAVQGTLDLAAQHARRIAEASRDRLRIFGDLASHDVAGAPYVQVMEVCDNNTCPICRERNGTIVPTGEAVAWMNRVVSAGPGKLDQTAPWIGTGAVAKHRQYTSSELNSQGKALPLYHLRCRGMTNAYFGDPGKRGSAGRGGKGSQRRAELDKLYPAEIEERIKGIQSGAGWAEGQLEAHYEKHSNGYASLDDYTASVEKTLQSPDRVMTRYYRDRLGTEHCQWSFYNAEEDTLLHVYQASGRIGTAYRSRAWRDEGYTRTDTVEVLR